MHPLIKDNMGIMLLCDELQKIIQRSPRTPLNHVPSPIK